MYLKLSSSYIKKDTLDRVSSRFYVRYIKNVISKERTPNWPNRTAPGSNWPIESLRLSLGLKNIKKKALRHLLSLMCQPEAYWLLKQRNILFCGWQNLNIKRLVCKQWVSLYRGYCKTDTIMMRFCTLDSIYMTTPSSLPYSFWKQLTTALQSRGWVSDTCRSFHFSQLSWIEATAMAGRPWAPPRKEAPVTLTAYKKSAQAKNITNAQENAH